MESCSLDQVLDPRYVRGDAFTPLNTLRIRHCDSNYPGMTIVMLTIASVKWHQQSLNYIDLAHIDSGGFSHVRKERCCDPCMATSWNGMGTHQSNTSCMVSTWCSTAPVIAFAIFRDFIARHVTVIKTTSGRPFVVFVSTFADGRRPRGQASSSKGSRANSRSRTVLGLVPMVC
jgi:hypothetical protein